MFTFYPIARTGNGAYGHAFCVSADEKPTDDICNGSRCEELDSGKVYLFDEENKQWIEQGAIT